MTIDLHIVIKYSKRIVSAWEEFDARVAYALDTAHKIIDSVNYDNMNSYNRSIDSIWEEYDKRIASAWEECQKSIESAWEEYLKMGTRTYSPRSLL
jgi:DNA-directed RNA polymerase subunit N (RpoN/RPB10)